MDLSQLLGLGILIAVIAGVFFIRRATARATGSTAKQQQKMEAMFLATFPELQPHFHPARVYEYVKARRARKASGGAFRWKSPPGFPAAAEAEVEPDDDRERVRLLDAAGAPFAAFIYQDVPEGGALRVGNGKLTATLQGPEPRVRYWHPDREFKWTPGNWKFQTRVSDREMESSDSGTSFSRDSSSDSTSTIARGAAATAGLAAAGGASGAWGEAGGKATSTTY